jgi:hypothetical protein
MTVIVVAVAVLLGIGYAINRMRLVIQAAKLGVKPRDIRKARAIKHVK